MSFRDLRNFTEMLRTLGYPRPVSMESFRNPNFPLLAELLVWLSRRLDTDAELPDGPYETEQDRVLLIRSAAQFLAIKANLKLNTKRLYGADGYAVRELLKVASLLYDALNATDSKDDDTDNSESIVSQIDINDKINELKQTRQLASEITANGATLHDLLGKEVDLRTQRQMSVARQLELGTVEAGVQAAIEALKKETDRTRQMIENVSATEASLDQRIERKRSELERNRNRLQTLQKVRPAFLDEFSALEKELQILYSDYVSRYRTMVYLESLVEEQERSEAVRVEAQQEAARKLAEQMHLEEEMEEDQEDMAELPKQLVSEQRPEESRLRVRTGVRPRTTTRANSRLFGKMQAESLGSDSSVDTSTDSESEDVLLDGEDIGDFGRGVSHNDMLDIDAPFSEGESEIDIEPQHQPPPPRRPSARVASSRPKVQDISSDDDF